MTDPVVNDMINRLVRMDTRRGLSRYARYPKQKTAIILVDVQAGFLAGKSRLLDRLSELLTLGRTHELAIYYSRYRRNAEPPFPTAAHNLMTVMLSGADAAAIPKELAPAHSDTVMEERRALSIFQGTGLLGELRERQLEHLILAGPLLHLSLDSSLRDASQYDFHVTLIESCVGEQNFKAGADTFELTFPRYAHSLLTIQEFESLVANSNGDQA